MAALSPQDIAHLSHLARLRLTDEERERFARQLSSVVGYVEQLSTAPAKDGRPAGVSGLTNVLAEDAPRTVNDPAAVSSQDLVDGAPSHDGRFIQVRAVLEEEA